MENQVKSLSDRLTELRDQLKATENMSENGSLYQIRQLKESGLLKKPTYSPATRPNYPLRNYGK